MSLRRAAFAAGRWTAVSAVLRAGLQILQTAILARLLSPGDYGLMAIIASVLTVIMLIADMGVSRALIHYDDISDASLSSLFWLGLGVAGMLTICLIVAAPVIARGFGLPGLAGALQTASLVIILTAIGQQYRALAEKRLSFGTLARIEVTAAALGFLVAVLTAWFDWRVYALVAGLLTSAATNSLLSLRYLSSGRRLRWRFELRETKPFLRFGTYLVGDSLIGTLHREADVFIGGLVSSPAKLGLYSVSRDLSLRVASVINPTLTRVSFPVMAQIKHDREQLKSIYLKSLRLTASINFPIYMTLLLFAHEVVALLYGPKWNDAAPFLQLMAAWGLIRSTGNPVGSLLYASGRPELSLWWNVVLLAVTVLVLAGAAAIGGLHGVVWCMLALQIALLVPIWHWLVRPLCDATFVDYFSQLLVPLFTSLIALGAATVAVMGLEGNVARLIVGTTCGALGYFVASYWLNRNFIDALLEAFHPRNKA